MTSPARELTLWVIADPAARHLRLLEKLPDTTSIVTGKTAEIFQQNGGSPDAILITTGKSDVLSQVWPGEGSSLRWVHSLSAGVEHILPFDGLRESAVPFTNAAGVYARSLGEYAVASMLFFAKNLRRMLSQQANGVWEAFDVEELHGKTLGVVGYGGIGKQAANRAKAFGMKILALRRNTAAPDEVVDEYVPREHLHSLLSRADYVVVSVPHTPETTGMIGEAELRAMPPNAVIINLGRGPAIVESALVDALRERRIRGAALDVFDVEPLPAGHPFYGLDNVLLSPHCADHTPTWLEDSMEFFLQNYERFASGQPLLNLVDKSAGY